MRTRALLLAALAALIFPLAGCGGSSGGGNDGTGGSNWDEMSWDEGTWQ